VNYIYKKIDNMDKLKLGDHTVLLYEDEVNIISSLVSFIEASLKRGEKCLYIEGDADTKLLIATLKKQLDDYDRYLKNSQLHFLSKEETYALSNKFKADEMIDLIKEEADQALKEGFKGLSITGELSWVLNFENGKREIIDYEWKLNDRIFHDYPVVALCRYNIDKFEAEIIKAVIELHHYIVWKGEIHENPYYIKPEGYKNNKVVDFEIKTWLENIKKYKKRESVFKDKLIEKENEYEFLFNQISDAVYLHEIVGKGKFSDFIKVNKAASKMLGYSRTELLQLSPHEIVDKKIQIDKHDLFDSNLSHSHNITYESIHISQGGKEIPVEMNLTSYAKGGRKYLLAIVRDITKRREDESKLLNAKNKLQAKNEELAANNEEIRAINDELESSYQELDRLTNNMESIIELISKIEVDMTEEEFLSVVLRNSIDLIEEADAGLIYLFKDREVQFIEGVNYDINMLNNLGIKKAYIKTHLGKSSEHITNNSVLDLFKTPDEVYESFIGNTTTVKSSLFINLRINQKVIGRLSLDILKGNEKTFSEGSKRLLSSFERLASSYLTLKRYNKLQTKFTDDVIVSLTNLLEIHDKYTKGHNEEVANMGRKIAKKMGLDQQMLKNTYRAGLLHDIGKIIIPEHILNKKGKLTDEEFDIIKKHPEWGFKALKNSEELYDLAEYILYHHERWDGKGYPSGLKGEEIPLVSQILTLADAWDAMNSERSYRKPLTEQEALEEIIKNKGKQFAPEVVENFLKLKEQTRLTYK